MAGIQNDPERDYSQKAYGKNILVVCESDRGDGEHSDSSGDDSRCARDDAVVNQLFSARDDDVAGGYRAGLKSESIWEECSGGLRIGRCLLDSSGATIPVTMTAVSNYMFLFYSKLIQMFSILFLELS
jgi:hypothetical protein